MSTRTTTEIIEFRYPFVANGEEAPLPAGRYEVETEEVTVEGLSFAAWRGVRTTLRWADAANGRAFAVDVDPDRLRAAIQDEASHPSPLPPVQPNVRPPADDPGPDRQRSLRGLLVPPVVIPVAIGLLIIAAIILDPRQ